MELASIINAYRGIVGQLLGHRTITGIKAVANIGQVVCWLFRQLERPQGLGLGFLPRRISEQPRPGISSATPTHHENVPTPQRLMDGLHHRHRVGPAVDLLRNGDKTLPSRREHGQVNLGRVFLAAVQNLR